MVLGAFGLASRGCDGGRGTRARGSGASFVPGAVPGGLPGLATMALVPMATFFLVDESTGKRRNGRRTFGVMRASNWRLNLLETLGSSLLRNPLKRIAVDRSGQQSSTCLRWQRRLACERSWSSLCSRGWWLRGGWGPRAFLADARRLGVDPVAGSARDPAGRREPGSSRGTAQKPPANRPHGAAAGIGTGAGAAGVGWMRPVILLPVTAVTGLPPDQLEAILAHELAHVRRYDYLVNLVQSVVETLLFYHPAAWWISGRIRAEREHCCDDWAVELCGDRLTYARALAALEEQRGAGWLLAPSARDGSLLARVRRLLGVSPQSWKNQPGAWRVRWHLRPWRSSDSRSSSRRRPTRPGLESRTGEAIVGTVVATDGQPVADADVWLAATDILADNP